MLNLRKQWPFWVSGVFVGVAEIMNYIVLEKPIGLTTGLVEMTAAFEQTVAPGIDWWSRAYDPNVHWIIIGVVVGAWLVARAERESRGWIKYPARELVLAFVGGFVFSFGTRLAHGCTTHHFLGGLPSMSTASLMYLLTILPAGFITFYLMTVMGIGHVFKGQENRATSEYGSKHGGKMGIDGMACEASRNYNPRRDWLRVSILVLMFAFFMNAIAGSFIYGIEDGLFGWNYAIMIGWQFFDIKLPLGMNPTWILLLGAACQGFGSVAMIGCEIRTYMRLGLGYMTAVAAFPGFLLGYLPYTLNVDYWEDLARDTTISKIKHVPDMFSHDPVIQALVGLAYGVLVAGLLVWSIKRGMRLTGFSFRDLMTHANDELTIKYFNRYSKTYGDKNEGREKETGKSGLSGTVTEGA